MVSLRAVFTPASSRQKQRNNAVPFIAASFAIFRTLPPHFLLFSCGNGGSTHLYALRRWHASYRSACNDMYRCAARICCAALHWIAHREIRTMNVRDDRSLWRGIISRSIVVSRFVCTRLARRRGWFSRASRIGLCFTLHAVPPTAHTAPRAPPHALDCAPRITLKISRSAAARQTAGEE